VIARVGNYLRAPATLAMVAVVVGFFIAQRLTLGADHISSLQRSLAFNTSRVRHGQWWRVVTANLLNGHIPLRLGGKAYDVDLGQPGLGHLLANVLGLLYIGPFLERRLGWRRLVPLAAVTGAVAYAWLLLLPGDWNVVDGTSGTVFGLYGVAVAVMAFDRHTARPARAFVVVLALLIVGGFAQQPSLTQHIHAGGFVSGLVLGAAMMLRRDSEPDLTA